MKNIFLYIKTKHWLKWPILALVVFIVLTILLMAASAWVNQKYQGVFVKGTTVGSVDVSGLSFEDARTKIAKQIDFFNQRGFAYVAPQKSVTIYPTVDALESADTSYDLVLWQIDETLNNIVSSQNLFIKIQTIIRGHTFPLLYAWDQQQHRDILQANFENILQTKQEADFKIVNNNLEITPAKSGQTIDFEAALAITEDQIKYLKNANIDLKIIEDKPVITEALIGSWKDKILVAASNPANLVLTYQEKTWEVPSETWHNWLAIRLDEKNKAYLGFKADIFDNYLTEAGIRPDIDRPVQDAKFQLTNGRVQEFASSQNGQAIDAAASLKLLEEELKNNSELKIALVVSVVEPKVLNDDVNDLGIVSIIGVGQSDFTGSPVNRVHNIGVGADTLNGVLIAPDEEFSLLKALGEIDGEHGYKQELVIKGDRTTPEYGGGLCQIGTTVFRAALATGLPITARRNHSYRVVYYEPAGTDATIYDPWPDFKFINDTGHHILIQTRIEGTKLYFDFWGTPDGRLVTQTDPVIYNIVAPPAKKIIKTTEIPVGTTKCTERAHSGADTKFDYTVQYADKPEPVATTFYSHYIPWQEVCLFGVTQEELDAETASSTPDGTDTEEL